ncbi:hypothetical protein QJQ45_016496 [Haematococcus lacustris]|nr:hypothetical protein QJQ45_016496 [Haematococcus lacustris]
MVQKKSVEEIWKELNAKPAARSASSNPAKAQNVIIPGLGSFTAPLPRPTASHQEAATPTPACPSIRLATAIPASGLSPPPHALSTSAATREPGGGGYDPTQVGLSHEAVATYIASMQRLINCLTDPDRGTRRQAALSLQTKLLVGDATTPAASPAMLQAVACGPLRVPLITMMHDVVEKCRAVAVELLEHCVKQVPDPCPLLPGLVPALLQRMGQLPVQEPAEEVRLSLVRLLAACVDRAPGKELGGHAADFTTVLCRALEDGFPDIKRLACSTCACLAARAPPGSLSPHSGKLVATLVVNLGHQHAKVRRGPGGGRGKQPGRATQAAAA